MAVNWLGVHYIEKPQIRVGFVFPKRGAPLLAQVAWRCRSTHSCGGADEC
jgi:hypothetical protein